MQHEQPPASRTAKAPPPRVSGSNKRDGKIMGVSAGIADHFGIDVTFVRVAWVIGTLVGLRLANPDLPRHRPDRQLSGPA